MRGRNEKRRMNANHRKSIFNRAQPTRIPSCKLPAKGRYYFMIMGKNIPGNRIALVNHRRNEPERFVEKIFRGAREHHTQKKYVPMAMNFSLLATSRWKPPKRRPPASSAGRTGLRSPSTLRLNRSNVKRKPAARGRT